MSFPWFAFVAWILLTLGIHLAATETLLAQTPAINQLKTKLQLNQPSSTRARLNLALGEAYLQHQLDSSILYSQKSIDLAQKLRDRSLLARAYLTLGHAYFRQSDFTKSILTLQKGEHFLQPGLTDSTLLEIQIYRAINHRSLGDYPEGLRHCLAILNQYDKSPTQYYRQLGMVYTELGVIYDHLHRYDLALVYHQKRLALSKQRSNKRDLVVAYMNMGSFYSNIHQLSKAQVYFQQSLSIARQSNLVSDIASLLINLGDIAYEREQYAEAIKYHNQALPILDRVGQHEHEGWALLMLANDYEKLSNYSTSLRYIDNAITIFQSIQADHYLQKALAIKSQLLTKTGHYREALDATNRANSLKDSLTGLEKQKAIAQVQASYDLERKQRQITDLRKDLTIQNQAWQTMQLQLNLAQQQRLLFMITALLLVLLLGFGYVSYQKQKKNQQLLLHQKNEITQQAQQLTELNAAKDKLFSLVSHDLRSPVAHLKQTINQFRSTTPINPSLLKPLSQLENQVDRILDLLTNLLEWSQSQLTGFKTWPRQIDLADAVLESISQFSSQLRQKNIGLINQIPPSIHVEADKHQLNSILRNTLSNAIKFTPEGGFIRVRAEVKADQIELVIKDSGIGMNAEELARLFTEPQVRPGTQGEHSTGLGLRLCQDLIARQAGSLTITSQANKGTTVRIRLPKGVSESVTSPEFVPSV